MSKKKCSAEVSIDTSCPPPTFEDYHRFTILDPQSKYKGHEGYVVRNWFPASTMPLVVDKLGQIEDLMDKHEVKDVNELDNRLKALERIKKHTLSYDGDVYKTLTNSREMQVEDIDIIEKALKALEIINDKNIDVYWLKTSPNLSRYNLAVGTNQALKKKEYDLLKEVLL